MIRMSHPPGGKTDTGGAGMERINHKGSGNAKSGLFHGEIHRNAKNTPHKSKNVAN